jgi:hypothetical protein
MRFRHSRSRSVGDDPLYGSVSRLCVSAGREENEEREDECQAKAKGLCVLLLRNYGTSDKCAATASVFNSCHAPDELSSRQHDDVIIPGILVPLSCHCQGGGLEKNRLSTARLVQFDGTKHLFLLFKVAVTPPAYTVCPMTTETVTYQLRSKWRDGTRSRVINASVRSLPGQVAENELVLQQPCSLLPPPGSRCGRRPPSLPAIP